MLVAFDIKVGGVPIRASGFEIGKRPGSWLRDWSITPAEDAMDFEPPDLATDVPVDIRVSVNGQIFDLITGGRLQGRTDGFQGPFFRQSIDGIGGAWRLLEKGPLRDTVFVPRTIIREIYPMGIKIVTLSGESVLGIPPRTRDDTSAPNIASPRVEMIEEAEWLNRTDVVCDPLQAFQDAYARASLPEFVIVGGDGGLKHKTYLDNETQPDDACLQATIDGRRIAGGVNRVTINSLVELIAKKAGFTAVKNNCPDTAMFEPFTVSSGTMWVDAIRTLVAPWNPEFDVEGTTLLILDIEAADITKYGTLRLSGEGLRAISRQVSRLPPYRGSNILGPLRAGLEALREFSRGPFNTVNSEEEQDCTPPTTESGIACSQNALPRNYKVEAPPKSERVNTFEREEYGGIPEVAIGPEQPYNIEITRTFSNGSALSPGEVWNGHEKVDWQNLTIRKLYFADPALGRIQLRFLERRVTGSTRTISRQVTRVIQGRFGNTPCEVINEEYGFVSLPGSPFGAERLLRRTRTHYTANLDVEGTWDAITDEYVLTIFSVGLDGTFYKPVPYHEAAHAGAIDTSANTIDSYVLAHYSRTTESYQVIDEYFGQKETATVYSFGGQPATGDVEVFALRDARQGSFPQARQRYCFDTNIDGGLIQMILAVGAATEEHAKLVDDRAKRRGGQRSVRGEVELPTYLPGVRSGTGVPIDGVPIRVLNQSGTTMTTTIRMPGNFYVNGYRYRAFKVGPGAFRLHTGLSIRSQF